MLNFLKALKEFFDKLNSLEISHNPNLLMNIIDLVH